MESNLTNLREVTLEFFKKHWNSSSKNPPPEWSAKWMFLGEVPNNTRKGCYCFLKDDEVKYVGVALNSGLPGYKGHSLGARISKYWRRDSKGKDESGNQFYKPAENLISEGINGITTLPFPDDDQEYLALALELFLIRKLAPKMNIIHKVKSD